MVNNRKQYILLFISFVFILNFAGCATITKIEKKLGLRNDYFEFLNSDNIEEISIQSTRDLGFKFIVTEPSAISDMYELLSRAKISENKSTLQPDYIFEFKIGDEVKNFYYVVGSDEGNFYNNDVTFTVSKRLDEGLIKNLSFIRKPREFEVVYYDSILDVLGTAVKNENIKDLKVGIDINGDIDCLKYVFSIDLNDFIKRAKKIIPSVELVNNNSEDFDVVVAVKNRGYDTTNFKTLITINNKLSKTQNLYYIIAVNEFKEWNISITGPNPDELPEQW